MGTLLGRHRRFVAVKGDDGARRRTGRPPTATALKSLVRRLAGENPRGGHRRIQGEWARLGRIAASAVGEMLHAAGIDPAPRRSGPAWREVLTARAAGSIAVDFFPLDTALGRRLCAPAFPGHGARRLHITGSPPSRCGSGRRGGRGISPPTSGCAGSPCGFCRALEAAGTARRSMRSSGPRNWT
ncbi:helix-turn-helix domain-containing protein [Streptomyces sp. JNUCC 63]